jgi:hypothetical protein
MVARSTTKGKAVFATVSGSRRFALAAMTAIGLALAGVAQAASDQDFRLINQTGGEINQVFVSRSDNNSWGKDVLGADVLPNGSSTGIVFPAGTQGCGWDLRVIYSDQSKAEWRKINLCSVTNVTLYHDRKTGGTRAVTE